MIILYGIFQCFYVEGGVFSVPDGDAASHGALPVRGGPSARRLRVRRVHCTC